MATVEFALIGGLLLTFVIGIMEASRYLMTLEALRTVTADAARMVVLRGSANLNANRAACTNMAGALSGASARTGALDPASLSVVLSNCATNAGVTTVTVTVTYPFQHSVPMLPNPARELRETARAIFH
ncbi:pilus assembly protein [Roseomonas sp. SSH11]|uniref:Pilus assembly protein n=1 Tax=Pararoseomonas baculiformis TaxID=2820812 RepID=A0ABS4AE76_9PROT|nr:TadE family protein [Pararoseomonas baculiformis]MBP0445295.1 pilus assembly protein [Pararoseomonas baculiformis]